MPANNVITPLLGGAYYHIFNRGINSNNIFFKPENYHYLLFLWKKYIHHNTDVFAYCLLPNHFHFLIKISDEITIEDQEPNLSKITGEAEVGIFVTEKLRRMFISFSQAINRQENRSGNLFNRNYKRIMIENEDHLRYLFFYIHNNPVKHKIVDDFRKYKFSSYQAYIGNNPTNVAKNKGLDLFNGIENFLHFHSYFHNEQDDLNLE